MTPPIKIFFNAHAKYFSFYINVKTQNKSFTDVFLMHTQIHVLKYLYVQCCWICIFKQLVIHLPVICRSGDLPVPSNKSSNVWSLGGCWHWHQDILCQSSSPVYDLNEQQGLPRAVSSLKAWNSGVASLCGSAVVSEPQQICNTPGLQNESHVHKPAP